MENKGQTIFLSVIGIATLLVAIVGATFAWFSATVQGNEEASSISVRAATIASVVFAEQNTITEASALPGWTDVKNFTVTRPAGSTINQNYTVSLSYTNEGITDLYYILTKNTVEGSETAIIESSATITIDSGSFTSADEEVNTYALLIGFKETGSDQNDQQGKQFAGLIQVAVDGGTDIYYNHSNPSGTTTMPGAE